MDKFSYVAWFCEKNYPLFCLEELYVPQLVALVIIVTKSFTEKQISTNFTCKEVEIVKERKK